MSFDSIEKEIIERIVPIREEFEVIVQALPELPSLWGEVTGQGWVTVRWAESEFVEDSYSVGEFSSFESIKYSLDVRVKELRGSKGLYPVLKMLKNLLWGFTPSLCVDPITLGVFKFMGTAEDYWVAQGEIMTHVFANRIKQTDHPLLVHPDTDTYNTINPNFPILTNPNFRS